MMARTTKLVPPAKSARRRQRGRLGSGECGRTGELVELEGPCYGEEGKLVGDGDEEGYGEVVVV